MRLSAYLSISRHGVFYFRLPIPATMHPAQKRTSARVSLSTRCPATATRLSRVLVLAGQSLLTCATTAGMRYDEIRKLVQEHFRDLLRQLKDIAAADGPPDRLRLDALKAAQGFAEGDLATWLTVAYPQGEAALLTDFCARRGIPEAALVGANRRWLLDALQAGHASFASEALNHVRTLAHIDLSDELPQAGTASGLTSHDSAPAQSVADVAATYFDEIKRTRPLAVKTELDRKEILILLDEVTGQKTVTAITKSDAQKVKQVLLRRPKNRSKMPETRGKTLEQMLAVEGAEIISPRRVSTHLSNL